MLSSHHEKKCRYSQCALQEMSQIGLVQLSFLLQCLERSKQASKKTKSKLVFRHCFWQCAKSCQEKKGRNCNDDKFWINTMPARILSKSPWAADLPGSNSSFRAKCEQLLSSLKVTFQMHICRVLNPHTKRNKEQKEYPIQFTMFKNQLIVN